MIIGGIVLGSIYLIVLAPLAWALARMLRDLSDHPYRTQIYEGIAASSLVAICAALLLTRGIGLEAGILAWVAFTILSGISISMPQPFHVRSVLACAVAPSLVLLGTLLAIYLIPVWLEGSFGAVASTSGSFPATPPSSLAALSFTLFVSVVSVPAIAVAVYARNRVIAAGKTIYGADPEQLGRVEKLVNTAVRISVAVAAIFVATG